MIQLVYLFLIVFFIYYIIQLLRGEAIYIPLPQKTIEKMLKMAEVSKKNILYDLGSGDGRVLITASKKFGCKCVGIEKNYFLYLISKFKVKRADVEDRVKIIHNDFFKERIDDATVVFMYLSRKTVNNLKKKFERELKKGTRIVTADHKIKGWEEIKKIKTGHFYSYLYKI
jgi:cyclopropane fatty-acyl-phospholipid synthase-like methyltransferase